ncbi:uncharacterized protein LOC110400125 [Numida meleagris]|uniref:uncharacterized protein LOC110400125 n=1 Tax=Numida meleagris TaxID=8996 RepID=UPI000B3DC299|nr:uncharacterized protein LOC110400125 [Numida meleagris]
MLWGGLGFACVASSQECQGRRELAAHFLFRPQCRCHFLKWTLFPQLSDDTKQHSEAESMEMTHCILLQARICPEETVPFLQSQLGDERESRRVAALGLLGALARSDEPVMAEKLPQVVEAVQCLCGDPRTQVRRAVLQGLGRGVGVKCRLRPWQHVKGAGIAHALNVLAQALQSQGCSKSFFLPFFLQVPPILCILRSCVRSMQQSMLLPILCQAVVILTRCHAELTIDNFFRLFEPTDSDTWRRRIRAFCLREGSR